MSIAVVLLHYNRWPHLRLSLRALQEQTLSPSKFHVVVADDGSTDGTADEMRRLVQTPEWKGRLHFVSGGPHDGARLTRLHNIGVANIPAECTFFAVIASDMCFAPDALEQIASLHKQHPEAIMITRLDWLPPMTHAQIDTIWEEEGYEGLLKRVPQEPMYWLNDTFVGLETRPLRETAILEALDTYPIHPVYGLPTELFWRVGGYDENMRGYGWQDLELALRLQQQNVSMITTMEIRALHIWHEKDTEIKDLVSWQRQKNAAYVLRKHGPHIKTLEFRNWKYWGHYHRNQGGRVLYVVGRESGLYAVNDTQTHCLQLPHAGWLYPLGFSTRDVKFVRSDALATITPMGMAQDWLNEFDLTTLAGDLETVLAKRLEDWNKEQCVPVPIRSESVSLELFHRYDGVRGQSDHKPGASLPIVGLLIRILWRVALAGKVWSAERQLLQAIVEEIDELRPR